MRTEQQIATDLHNALKVLAQKEAKGVSDKSIGPYYKAVEKFRDELKRYNRASIL